MVLFVCLSFAVFPLRGLRLCLCRHFSSCRCRVPAVGSLSRFFFSFVFGFPSHCPGFDFDVWFRSVVVGFFLCVGTFATLLGNLNQSGSLCRADLSGPVWTDNGFRSWRCLCQRGVVETYRLLLCFISTLVKLLGSFLILGIKPFGTIKF